jgi:hypothetical protein
MDKLSQKQIEFHLNKVSLLERELETRKSAGEKRIQKAEAELRLELDRLRDQINGHLGKVENLRNSD